MMFQSGQVIKRSRPWEIQPKWGNASLKFDLCLASASLHVVTPLDASGGVRNSICRVMTEGNWDLAPPFGIGSVWCDHGSHDRNRSRFFTSLVRSLWPCRFCFAVPTPCDLYEEKSKFMDVTAARPRYGNSGISYSLSLLWRTTEEPLEQYIKSSSGANNIYIYIKIYNYLKISIIW